MYTYILYDYKDACVYIISNIYIYNSLLFSFFKYSPICKYFFSKTYYRLILVLYLHLPLCKVSDYHLFNLDSNLVIYFCLFLKVHHKLTSVQRDRHIILNSIIFQFSIFYA